MRKEYPAIIDGDLKFELDDHPHIIMYTRNTENETLLVIANFSSDKVAMEIPEDIKSKKWERVLTNYSDATPSLERNDQWMPWEAEVYKLK